MNELSCRLYWCWSPMICTDHRPCTCQESEAAVEWCFTNSHIVWYTEMMFHQLPYSMIYWRSVYHTIWELVKHHSTAASLSWQVQGLWYWLRLSISILYCILYSIIDKDVPRYRPGCWIGQQGDFWVPGGDRLEVREANGTARFWDAAFGYVPSRTYICI